MSSSTKRSSDHKYSLTGQNIVYAGIAWSILSLIFFLLFSVTAPGEDSPLWYMLGTYILECIPFLIAAKLCYRNWCNQTIISGRNVWLGIGLGMLLYFIGGLLFGWWELCLGLDPDVSPADFLYLVSYLFIGWGMILAILPRRLNLERKQWEIVVAIAVAGIAFAVWVLIATPEASDSANLSASGVGSSQMSTPLMAPKGQASSLEEITPMLDAGQEKQPPTWAIAIENVLNPLSGAVNFFYIVGDVFLLIIASTLLLAFWGGRFVQSWRMIAAATFSLYIADMWSKYAEAVNAKYESGGFLEVFFVFSAVLFAIGAALEYEVSSRSRRSIRKRV